MDIQIIDEPLTLVLYGVSGAVEDGDYGAAGSRLMDLLWKEISDNGLQHKGINFWVYEAADRMFTAVELEAEPESETSLELKEITVARYVSWKHVGDYSLLGKVHADMNKELERRRLQPRFPAIERYGHWTEDVSRLETDIFIPVG